MSGTIEVRGIVNKDSTVSYGEFTQYDNEFGKLRGFSAALDADLSQNFMFMHGFNERLSDIMAFGARIIIMSSNAYNKYRLGNL